jgi:hypothetical protein
LAVPADERRQPARDAPNHPEVSLKADR